MSGSELQDFGSDQPIWRFVAEVGADRFTGEAELGVDPRLALFATEGHVYAAEFVDGPTIGQRLVQAGALTPEQLAKGAVHVGDTLSLARMFQREPSIDRDQVELALEQMTAELLDSVSSYPVGQVTLRPLRHHPSGVHQWRPEAAAPAPSADGTMAALVAAMSTVVDQPVAAPAPSTVPAALPPPPPTAVAAAFPAPPAAPSDGEPAATTPALPTLGTVTTWEPDAGAERATPQRFEPKALDSQQLPKLMDRPMSMVEITTAHAIITGETPPPVEESIYAPVAVEGLPTLQGFAPLAASSPDVVDHQIATDDAGVEEAAEEQLDEQVATPEPVLVALTAHETTARDTLHIPSFEALLDTPTTDWSTPAQPPAVQEIWDMVDDLLGLPHHDVAPGHPADPPIDTSATPPVDAEHTAADTPRRTWKRSRKG